MYRARTVDRAVEAGRARYLHTRPARRATGWLLGMSPATATDGTSWTRQHVTSVLRWLRPRAVSCDGNKPANGDGNVLVATEATRWRNVLLSRFPLKKKYGTVLGAMHDRKVHSVSGSDRTGSCGSVHLPS